jgi:hypothetical protein
MTRVVMVVFLLAFAVTAAAQEPAREEATALAQAAPRPTIAPPRPVQPAPAAAAPAPAPPQTAKPAPPQTAKPAPTESAASQQNDPINVRYEITLRDEGGPRPQTKNVTLLTTLGDISSVRVNPGPSQLNVDAWPMGYRDGRVRTRISIEYNPPNPDTPESPVPTISIRETVFVWLESGKPLVVSQSADPRSDRRLTVEVTATLLK